MCDGASREEVIADLDRAIADHGYTLCGVADESVSPWAYTVALVDHDHPELIIASVSRNTSVRVLNALAQAVLDGDRVELGEHLTVAGELVRMGAVDPVQYALDTFAMWHALSDAGAVGAELEALQVVLEWGFCPEHQDAQPILSDPKARVGAPLDRPNRAARRRAQRHRGRG
jgi:Domain of unknown function (DUF4262)